MKRIVLVAITTLLFYSCSEIDEPDNIDNIGKYELFDSIPTNLIVVNSEFDDYNSAWPPGTWGLEHELVFSSNRNSNGENFDFVSYYLSIMYTVEEGSLIEINGSPIHESFWRQSYNYLNTEYDEMYPSIQDSDFYFTSDRTGNFDLYTTEILNENLFNSFELELSPAIENIEILSSEYDEKCPFVSEDIMVFTSNRLSGYGGYDVYYSIKTDKGWSGPVNFGENINSEFDEYRPIIIPVPVSTNNLMIFSSNRPGGLGGFDLYYVGVFK